MMFVRELGVGPVVVLLHGTPSPPQDLLPLATELARRYCVLVPDLPGYGQTAAVDELTVERYADAVAEMLAANGVTRVRAVAGFSSGAYIALDLVLRELVAADLVVSLGGLATFDDAARTFRRDVARAIRLDPSTITRDLDALMPTLMLSPAWRAAHPEDDARAASWLHLTSPHVVADELAALAEARDLRP
ncbi:MAG: alpha/beta fold hydrolase, partial [Deltaproteobacteria bacterium]|nr:alpha/beta fold hydrolase [Deltaproteobacteria bacterium]